MHKCIYHYILNSQIWKHGFLRFNFSDIHLKIMQVRAAGAMGYVVMYSLLIRENILALVIIHPLYDLIWKQNQLIPIFIWINQDSIVDHNKYSCLGNIHPIILRLLGNPIHGCNICHFWHIGSSYYSSFVTNLRFFQKEGTNVWDHPLENGYGFLPSKTYVHLTFKLYRPSWTFFLHIYALAFISICPS